MTQKREVRIAGVTSFGGEKSRDSVPERGTEHMFKIC